MAQVETVRPGFRQQFEDAVMRVLRPRLDAIDRWMGRMSLIGNTEIVDRSDFPWVDQLEADWEKIRDELDAILVARARLPNIQDISAQQRYLSSDDGWKTYFLYGYGHWTDDGARRCPETTRLLKRIPGLTVAFFSILSPGKHIPAHTGAYKGVVRCHLGLKVPAARENCQMRVGKTMLNWEEGKAFLFDDTCNHEVWNETDEWRVVLLLDVERPFPRRLAAVNRFLLRLFAFTPAVTGALKKQREWERKVLAAGLG